MRIYLRLWKQNVFFFVCVCLFLSFKGFYFESFILWCVQTHVWSLCSFYVLLTERERVMRLSCSYLATHTLCGQNVFLVWMWVAFKVQRMLATFLNASVYVCVIKFKLINPLFSFLWNVFELIRGTEHLKLVHLVFFLSAGLICGAVLELKALRSFTLHTVWPQKVSFANWVH